MQSVIVASESATVRSVEVIEHELAGSCFSRTSAKPCLVFFHSIVFRSSLCCTLSYSSMRYFILDLFALSLSSGECGRPQIDRAHCSGRPPSCCIFPDRPHHEVFTFVCGVGRLGGRHDTKGIPLLGLSGPVRVDIVLAKGVVIFE